MHVTAEILTGVVQVYLSVPSSFVRLCWQRHRHLDAFSHTYHRSRYDINLYGIVASVASKCIPPNTYHQRRFRPSKVRRVVKVETVFEVLCSSSPNDRFVLWSSSSSSSSTYCSVCSSPAEHIAPIQTYPHIAFTCQRFLALSDRAESLWSRLLLLSVLATVSMVKPPRAWKSLYKTWLSARRAFKYTLNRFMCTTSVRTFKPSVPILSGALPRKVGGALTQ